MKKILVLIFTAIFCSLPVFSADFDECTKLLNDKRYPDAVSCYNKYSHKYRYNPQFKLYYGYALCHNRQYSLATENFDYVIKRLPPGGYADYAVRYKQKCNAMLNKEKVAAAAKKTPQYISDIDRIAIWAKKPINYWVEYSDYYSVAVEAFREWERETSYAVSFRKVGKPEYADIKVYFVDSLGGGNIVGVTYNNKNLENGRYILKNSNIKILQKTASGSFRSKYQIRPVILHEIGHALGLEGHSSNKNDMLYHTTDYYKQNLSKRDIETIRQIYGK